MVRRLVALVLALACVSTAHADRHNEQAARRQKRAAARVPDGVTLQQNLVYARIDDKTDLLLDLYLPKDVAGKPPLLVWVHGGGWRSGSKDITRYAWLAQEGYALASINYRLSGKAKFPAQIHDCKAAIRWLRAHADQHGYDATRIGVAGSSAGGHLVALLGTSGGVTELEGGVGGFFEHSSRVQAVFDLYGPADLTTMPEFGNVRRKDRLGALGRLLGGHPADKPDLAKLGSPVTHITADDAPFLIAHGTTDRLVPVQQSRDLHANLQAAGVTSSLHVLEGAGHGGRAFQTDAWKQRVLRFFGQHIRGEAPVTPPAADPEAPPTVLGTFAARGPHEIASVALTKLGGKDGAEPLQVRITYPRVDTRVPVIIWSHGAFGSKDRYQPLVEHWARHGYVVLQANHRDSLELTGGQPDLTTLRRWADRPKDIARILDALPKLRKRMKKFAGALDTGRIGVGGHSFGAHTAQLLGGATTRSGPDGAHESHADARVRAVLLLSAQGTGEMLDASSWRGLTKPALVVTGTEDHSARTGKPYTWRIEPYTHAPAGDKTLVVLEGAHHGFGGITGPGRRGRAAGPVDAKHVDTVRATSRLFWDAYLKDDPGAKLLLRSTRIPEETEGTVRVEFK